MTKQQQQTSTQLQLSPRSVRHSARLALKEKMESIQSRADRIRRYGYKRSRSIASRFVPAVEAEANPVEAVEAEVEAVATQLNIIDLTGTDTDSVIDLTESIIDLTGDSDSDSTIELIDYQPTLDLEYEDIPIERQHTPIPPITPPMSPYYRSKREYEEYIESGVDRDSFLQDWAELFAQECEWALFPANPLRCRVRDTTYVEPSPPSSHEISGFKVSAGDVWLGAIVANPPQLYHDIDVEVMDLQPYDDRTPELLRLNPYSYRMARHTPTIVGPLESFSWIRLADYFHSLIKADPNAIVFRVVFERLADLRSFKAECTVPFRRIFGISYVFWLDSHRFHQGENGNNGGEWLINPADFYPAEAAESSSLNA